MTQYVGPSSGRLLPNRLESWEDAARTRQRQGVQRADVQKEGQNSELLQNKNMGHKLGGEDPGFYIYIFFQVVNKGNFLS